MDIMIILAKQVVMENELKIDLKQKSKIKSLAILKNLFAVNNALYT